MRCVDVAIGGFYSRSQHNPVQRTGPIDWFGLLKQEVYWKQSVQPPITDLSRPIAEIVE